MDFSQVFNMDNLSANVWPVLVNYVPKIVGLFLALIITKVISNWAGKIVTKSLSEKDKSLQKFLSSLAKYSVLTIGVVAALSYVGIETASFAAVIAASGLAIGLAFQGTLSNFAAGVMLLIFKPFKTGDYVKAGGEEGFIDGLELFTTDIITLDNKKIIIPNSSIFGANITNYTANPIRRVDISVGTSYGADIDETRKILEQVPSQVKKLVDDNPAQIFLAALGTNSVDWQVRVWCKTEDYWDVYQDVTACTKRSLDKAGIGIPFPQQDLHFDKEFIKAIKSA